MRVCFAEAFEFGNRYFEGGRIGNHIGRAVGFQQRHSPNAMLVIVPNGPLLRRAMGEVQMAG